MADPTANLIATAARDALGPIGLRQRGRSRCWSDDHGWWLVNVEFQPSRGRHGCYLNVGEQHLWSERSHLIFERMARPLGASHFAVFDGDEEAFAREMQAVAASAANAVSTRRLEHGEGVPALERLAGDDDDLTAGIAYALLGNAAEARRRFAGNVHAAHRAEADGYLAALDRGTVNAHANTIVGRTRALLNLPPAELRWNA